MLSIQQPPTVPKHQNIIHWVNQLVIDLKLQAAGLPHDPITPERLSQWSALRAQLERDVEQVARRYVE